MVCWAASQSLSASTVAGEEVEELVVVLARAVRHAGALQVRVRSCALLQPARLRIADLQSRSVLSKAREPCAASTPLCRSSNTDALAQSEQPQQVATTALALVKLGCRHRRTLKALAKAAREAIEGFNAQVWRLSGCCCRTTRFEESAVDSRSTWRGFDVVSGFEQDLDNIASAFARFPPSHRLADPAFLGVPFRVSPRCPKMSGSLIISCFAQARR
eukprot:1598234-Rhodomonas_salina.1